MPAPPVTETSIAQNPLPDAARQEQLRAALTLMRICEDNMERRGDTDRLAPGLYGRSNPLRD